MPAGLGDGVGHCHDVAKLLKSVSFFISLVYLFGRPSPTLFFKSMGFSKPLDMLVRISKDPCRQRRGRLCTRRAAARYCAGLSELGVGLQRLKRRRLPRPLPGTLQQHAGDRSSQCEDSGQPVLLHGG